ncbi:MAG TPA: DoxX family protein [Kofleriaceae bacterium]|jgi:putative oxidoreductase|nr:DoxX family protein [Kofleriaceae bacterium]
MSARNSLSELEPIAYVAMRIAAGVMLVFPGIGKMFGVFGMPRMELGSQLWFGAIIEMVGGTLIAIGLFTRAAAFICSGMLAVAYFQFHWKLAFDDLKFLPIVNGGGFAALFAFVFLYIATRGPGRLALDKE